MTFDELTALLKKEGFTKAQLFITDATYARPMSEYLLGTFYDFYREWLSEHKLDVWKDRWDCDNFSSTFYVFAQMCHVKSARPEEGIAVGELFYYQLDGGGHAVNCAVTEKGFILIEPQTGKEFEMVDLEKEKVVMIRF